MLLALVIDYWFDDVKSGNLFFLSPWMPLALCFYRLLLYVKKLACMLSVKTDMSSSPRTLRRATEPMWRSPRQISISTNEPTWVLNWFLVLSNEYLLAPRWSFRITANIMMFNLLNGDMCSVMNFWIVCLSQCLWWYASSDLESNIFT